MGTLHGRPAPITSLPAPASHVLLAENEGYAVPTPDDDAVIRERDAGLDEWLEDRERAEAAADPDRVSYRDDLAGFIVAYRKFHGLADDETDPTPPGGPAPTIAA